MLQKERIKQKKRGTNEQNCVAITVKNKICNIINKCTARYYLNLFEKINILLLSERNLKDYINAISYIVFIIIHTYI